MSPTILKSPLACVLVAVMAISLLPPVFDHPGQAAVGQTGSNSRPRRGKNGQPAVNPKSGQAAKSTRTPARSDMQDQEATESEEDSNPTKTPPVDSRPGSGQADRPAAAPASRGAETSAQTRRTPPPFDRPPLSTDGQNGSSAPATATRQSQTQPSNNPGTQPGRGSSDRQPSSQPPNNQSRREREPADVPPQDIDPDDPVQDRSGKQAPVLRRPSESRQSAPRDSRYPQDGGDSRSQQEGQIQQPGDNEAIKLDATLVNLPLLVSDRAGRYVPRLSQRDFTLYEDGVQQEIAFFGSEEVPFNVVLLLDMSPSVAGYVDEIHRAAIEFVRQLRPQDRIMVVAFDRRVNFLTDFTNNRRLLENAIQSTSTGSGTSVYDAVFYSVQRKLETIEGRKALILFSDGEDTTSGDASYHDAIDSVTESEVLVYGLRYPSDGGGNIRVNPWPRYPVPQIPFPFPWPWPRRRRGPFTLTDINGQSSPLTSNAAASAQSRSGRRRQGDFMEDVATAGGGPVYDANQVSDISRLANRIAEELRHVYVVSYYPTNPLSNGGYRSIRVRVNGRDDIAVRHRRGYNAREIGSQPRT